MMLHQVTPLRKKGGPEGPTSGVATVPKATPSGGGGYKRAGCAVGLARFAPPLPVSYTTLGAGRGPDLGARECPPARDQRPRPSRKMGHCERYGVVHRPRAGGHCGLDRAVVIDCVRELRDYVNRRSHRCNTPLRAARPREELAATYACLIGVTLTLTIKDLPRPRVRSQSRSNGLRDERSPGGLA